MKTGFCKGDFCDASQIAVPVDSIGMNRGYAAFDFMKIVNKKPFYLDRHLNRFARTMSLLRIEIPYSANELTEIIESIVKKNSASNYGLKFFAVPLEISNSDTFLSDLFIVPVDLPVYQPEMFEKGSALITKEYARFLPEAKSTNYLPSILWENELKKYDAIEILYYSNNQVLEASKCNIFIVKNSQVFTPSLHVLKGITRSITIDILREKQIPFSEKEISKDELDEADEVFITSTTKGIAPVVRIDEKTVNNGEVGAISKTLIEDYQKLIE